LGGGGEQALVLLLLEAQPVALGDVGGTLGLGEMGFAQRLRTDSELRASVDAWFEAQAQRAVDVRARDWLRFEQDKHERLLAAAAALT
jgi:hypothetical protein